MANTSIQIKKSGSTGNVPDSLVYGEMALNYADGKLYYKNGLGSIDYISRTNSFNTINVGNNLLVATSPSQLLNIVAGNNVTISSNTLTNSFTIDSTGGGGGSGGNFYFNNTTLDRETYTATAGQTTFAVTYTNQVLVYINGVNIDPSEFTAVTGTSVVLTTPAAQYDIVDLIGFSSSSNTFIPPLVLANTVASTSTTTGTLVVGGGVGITGNVHVGGSISLDTSGQYISVGCAQTSSQIVTVTTPLQTIDSFDTTQYKSANYQVQAQNGNDVYTFNLNLAHDGSIVYYTIFGELYSNTKLVTIASTITSNTLNIYCTPQVASVKLSFVRSLIQK